MQTTYIIGRKGDIVLNDRAVSRRHAQLTISPTEVYLKDLNSSNGLYLLKNKRLIRFFEGYVQLNQVVAIGDRQYAISQLLTMVSTHAA